MVRLEHTVYKSIHRHIHDDAAARNTILTSEGAGNEQRNKLILTLMWSFLILMQRLQLLFASDEDHVSMSLLRIADSLMSGLKGQSEESLSDCDLEAQQLQVSSAI